MYLYRYAGNASSKKLIQYRCAGDSSAVMSSWSTLQLREGTTFSREFVRALRNTSSE
jgi:hypothetical protein